MLSTLLALTLLAADPLPRPQDLTPALRLHLDEVALAGEGETIPQEAVNLTGNLTAFLINQFTLTAQQEADLASKAHRELIAQNRVLPTPEPVQKVWQQLIAALPPALKPDEFTFQLTILDKEEPGCLTLGGGRVYLTRATLERLREREGTLAFVLASQLGHISHQDCRRGWQLGQLPEELKGGLRDQEEKCHMQRVWQTTLKYSGRIPYLLYSRQQCYQADLFAWQLCRNVRFDPEQALDALRLLSLELSPDLARDEKFRPDATARQSVLSYYLSEQPEPLNRLKRLLMERDGLPDEPDKMGLFQYDPASGGFTRPAARALPAEAAPIVFLHGMRGDESTFKDFLAFLAGQVELKNRPLLLFRFPENDSLGRSGIYLDRELTRLGLNRERADFICHSAGGLVFRYYAEKRSGPFHKAYFLGTPQHGSQLAKLKYLVDLADFASTLKLGLPAAIRESMPSWRSAVVFDLLPDSLFQHDLGDHPKQAGRYEIYCGKWLEVPNALTLRLALPAARTFLKQELVRRFPGLKDRPKVFQLIDKLDFPTEVLAGDGVVSLASARLRGVARLSTFNLDHLQIKQDEQVMRQVLASLLEITPAKK